MRKLLIDVCHPCEVHHYKNLYWHLLADGWDILFTAKDKDVTIQLLQKLDLPYILLSTNQGGIFRKLLHLPQELFLFLKLCLSFKPDVIISAVSIHAAWIAWLLRIPHAAFIDTEPRYLLDRFTLPFITYKFTSCSYYRDLGKNHFRYHGNHELAYLHPSRFTPDKSVLNDLQVDLHERFIICRFVAWNASHDIGKKGMDVTQKIIWIQQLAEKYRVFITSETPLPDALKKYELQSSPEKIHSILAFAALYVGEGITLASEAATLGTPAILINSLKMGYCLEEAKYDLLYQYNALTPEAVEKIEQLLQMPRAYFLQAQKKFLNDKIDVTEYMLQQIKKLPYS